MQCLAFLGAEDPGKSPNWEQEITAIWAPSTAIFRQCSYRGEVMDVRVVSQIAFPGMQDPHKADLATQEARILGQLLGGFSGKMKKQIAHPVLVTAGKLL